ncbi:MAG: glucose-6-phosphate isomerase [Aerococcaceae bacterium]|nr:glucose-6-phosphate isomerase [Aerococcaceae bacterium]
MELKINWQNKHIKQEFERYLNEHQAVLAEIVQGEVQFQNNLGWFDIDEWMSSEILECIKNFAEQVRKEADIFVLIGVGGSNNAARSVIKALATKNSPQVIYSGNTLSPHSLNQVLMQLEGKSVYIHCIAKNFETLEPGASFRVLRQYMEQRYGKDAYQRISVTGTTNSRLHALSQQEGYEFFAFPDNVGGRFTSLTSVGLLPMAVAGVNIEQLVLAAKQLRSRLLTNDTNNIAYQYAALRNFLYQKGYRIELLSSFEPQFNGFYKWWWQLFGESEGKKARGIYPSYAEYSEDLHSIGQFVQEGNPIIFETMLNVEKPNSQLLIKADTKIDNFDYLDGQDFWDINQVAYRATFEAHLETIPAIPELLLEAMDERAFGELFYFFQFSCYLSCKLMGVNPFDQPGVEAYKERMFKALKQF